MDIDIEPVNVYVMCPKCNELSIQKSNEYPIVCCNIPGMTFGSGKCSRCSVPILKDNSNLDICLTCSMLYLNI